MFFVNTAMEDTEVFCRDFEKQESILLLPGNKYGKKYKSFIRMGFGGDSQELAYCLSVMDQFLKNSIKTIHD